MANYADGRMIRKTVSDSETLPKLSADSLNLFFMMIPHYSSHGKMNGNPHTIKGMVVPKFDKFTLKKIESCLKEISQKTRVKWFQLNGQWYIHSLDFTKSQKIDINKVGKDHLPSYNPDLLQTNSRVTPELGSDKVEVEVEVEVEREVEICPFEDFWKAYPKKTAKAAALKAWERLVVDETLSKAIFTALEAHKRSPDWLKQDGQFIPYPATWLNGKRWEDCTSETETYNRKQSEKTMKEIWKASGLSTCHGKKIIDGKDGAKICDYCLCEQTWAKVAVCP